MGSAYESPGHLPALNSKTEKNRAQHLLLQERPVLILTVRLTASGNLCMVRKSGLAQRSCAERAVKIPGRETEVRREVQLVLQYLAVSLLTLLVISLTVKCRCAGNCPARRYSSEMHHE